ILNIELRSEDGSQLIKSTTQPFDSFQFDDVPRGTYTVRIHSSAKVQKYLYPIEKPTSALENAPTRFADFRVTMDGTRPQFENFVIDWD
ncbi:MAG TPA: hypothetical protein PLK77_14490, partial [Pyrinomonadaceae bacterium]|nr:hypothetical protein [Pyrinomonadaceae bacterium]